MAFLLGGVLTLGALPALAQNDPEDKAARPDASSHGYRYGQDSEMGDRDRDREMGTYPTRSTTGSEYDTTTPQRDMGTGTGTMGTGTDTMGTEGGSMGEDIDEGSRDMR
ncbi:MAG: hypothetical protein DCC71_09090 [Proteobacteria bacterium]|nr:MAG: hypothetical protein DCC71_09090 [Pseudomonadota bacterium]